MLPLQGDVMSTNGLDFLEMSGSQKHMGATRKTYNDGDSYLDITDSHFHVSIQNKKLSAEMASMLSLIFKGT